MFLAHSVKKPLLVLDPLLDRGEQDFLFLVGRAVEELGVAVLGADAEMDQQRGVAAVVEDHVRRAAVVPLEDLVGVVPVVLQALALDREHRHAVGGDRRGGVVLRRIDVAGGPAHVGAERGERLDQHAGLDRHVQRAGDAGALERLLRAVFLAGRHQAGHLDLGDGEFLAAPFGEPDVLDDVFFGDGHDCPCWLEKWVGARRKAGTFAGGYSRAHRPGAMRI